MFRGTSVVNHPLLVPLMVTNLAPSSDDAKNEAKWLSIEAQSLLIFQV